MEFPNYWIQIKLDKITSRITNGSSLKQLDQAASENMLPITRIETIANEVINLTRVKYVDANNDDFEKYGLKYGDILFSHINSDKHLGKTAIFSGNEKIIHGINLLLIRTTPNYDPFFLNYLFKFYRSRGEFVKVAQRAVNQSSINQKKLKEFTVPLPPLNEQKRIVTKLDKLFAYLDTLKARMERIPELLKQFRQAVLTQAVTGKLTKNINGFKQVVLSDIAYSITDGDHQAPPKANQGIPFIVISNLTKGELNLSNVDRFVPSYYFRSLKDTKIPQKGDILYTVTGSYGISVTVNTDKNFCFQRHIAIIKPIHKSVLSEYLNIYLNSYSAFTQAESVATGTAQKTVPLKGLRNFTVPLPNIKEQSEIVRRVEALFEKADLIERQYELLNEKIEHLPQAILAKAFRGELVAQDPNDEPAEALLERIQAEKEGRPVKKKPGKQYKLNFDASMVTEDESR